MPTPPTRCHALPCNIESSSKAPTSVFFQPAVLEEDPEVEAACFRGRGLLAKAVDENNITVCLLRPEKSGERKTLQLVEKYHLQEWRHEHDPKARALHLPGRGRHVADWMEVSRALHGPLPPPTGS